MTELSGIKLHIIVEVNSTEDPDKVNLAVRNVLGEIDLNFVKKRNKAIFIGEGKDFLELQKLKELLRRERILSASRKILIRGIKEKTIRFNLNKQAAYVGHISFCRPEGESPLGSIKVKIECDNPHSLINWLAPRLDREPKEAKL